MEEIKRTEEGGERETLECLNAFNREPTLLLSLIMFFYSNLICFSQSKARARGNKVP